MARPQRNNVDYFPFYCEDGKKMFYLEETYGNDGFATFVKLLRELAKSDYHYLDLSKNTTTMFLSAKCKVSKEILESIINDLVELEKFDPMLWNENRVIWCGDFIASIQDAYNKRNNKCITYDGLVTLLIGLGVRKHGLGKSTSPVNTQSKVKETKLNKSIVKESSKKPSLFSDSEFFDLDKFENEILKDEKYMCFDIKYYFEALKNWSEENNKKINWIATAKNWMLRDSKDGKAKVIQSMQAIKDDFAKYDFDENGNFKR